MSILMDHCGQSLSFQLANKAFRRGEFNYYRGPLNDGETQQENSLNLRDNAIEIEREIEREVRMRMEFQNRSSESWTNEFLDENLKVGPSSLVHQEAFGSHSTFGPLSHLEQDYQLHEYHLHNRYQDTKKNEINYQNFENFQAERNEQFEVVWNRKVMRNGNENENEYESEYENGIDKGKEKQIECECEWNSITKKKDSTTFYSSSQDIEFAMNEYFDQNYPKTEHMWKDPKYLIEKEKMLSEDISGRLEAAKRRMEKLAIHFNLPRNQND